MKTQKLFAIAALAIATMVAMPATAQSHKDKKAAKKEEALPQQQLEKTTLGDLSVLADLKATMEAENKPKKAAKAAKAEEAPKAEAKKAEEVAKEAVKEEAPKAEEAVKAEEAPKAKAKKASKKDADAE